MCGWQIRRDKMATVTCYQGGANQSPNWIITNGDATECWPEFREIGLPQTGAATLQAF